MTPEAAQDLRAYFPGIFKGELDEGTWSAPYTKGQAEKVRDMLENPLSPAEAKDKLYDLLGNDDLFDEIQQYDRDEDVRPAVVKYIRDTFVRNFDQSQWKHDFEPEALKILQDVGKQMKQLTEDRLRSIIHEELQRLREAAVDRGFLNGFADGLEDLTGRDAHFMRSKEDAVRFDSLDGDLDIIFRTGGSKGGRFTSGVEIQIYDRKGKVRTSTTVPNDPDVAAEEVVSELEKINAV
jgi:hypothetical protein